MRLVIQRVSRAAVRVDGRTTGQIGRGLVTLVGVARGDSESDVDYLVEKVLDLRVFEDSEGKMNRSIRDLAGEAGASESPDGAGILSISQFTLHGDCRKGRRPSYSRAESPDRARQLYELWGAKLAAAGFPPQDGVFGAHMDVELVNDGPVTLLLDSAKTF